MRMQTRFWQRFLAALLSFVMVLGMLPTANLFPAAQAAEGDTTEGTQTYDATSGGVEAPKIDGNYITLPITIRDFAADGMLFEYNEVYRHTEDGETNSYTEEIKLSHEIYDVIYNPWYWDRNSSGTLTEDFDFKGIRVYSADYAVYDSRDESEQDGNWWYCLILNAHGKVIKVLELDSNKRNVDTVIDNTTGAAYSVWAWKDSTNVEAYTLLEQIYNKYQTALTANGGDEAAAINALDEYLCVFGVSGSDNAMTACLTPGRYYTNTSVASDNKGIYIYDGQAIVGWLGGLDGYNSAWLAVVIDADTNEVVDVVPKIPLAGQSENPDRKSLALADYLNSSYQIVMVWDALENWEYRDLLTRITDDTASEYAIVEQTSANNLYLTRTRLFHEADTKAFGLLSTNEHDYLNVLSGTNTIGGTESVINGSYGSSTVPEVLESKLYDAEDRSKAYATQDIYGANVRTNLVDKELGKNGKPQYTKETVEFLAGYMEQIMAVEERNADGTYNSYFVTGVKLFDEMWNYVDPHSPDAIYTLADLIRDTMDKYDEETIEKYGNTIGTYEDSRAKFEAGGLTYAYLVRSWCDVAYYLLHTTWLDSLADTRNPGTDGYGYPIDRYDSLHLVEKTNTDGSVYYTFNARYEDSVYDYNNGQIYNTQTDTYSHATLNSKPFYTYGNALPEDRFDPLGPLGAGVNLGYGMSGNTYGNMVGTYKTQSWADFYDNTNYNLSLEGHAKFVYHEDANQYFTFTGDDDVYLYINGIRVLDIGAAHSISMVKVDINKVAEACGLHDGETYAFDFFYLERHGTAANFGIETNIQLAVPELTTTKEGYQKGGTTGYNGFVDPDESVGYSFTVANGGNTPVANLSFNDPDIGIYFGYDKCVLNSDSNWSNMYLVHWNADGSYKQFIGAGSLTAEKVSAKLATGLDVGEKLGIYGFRYLIPDAKWDDTSNGKAQNTFLNTVYTTGYAVISGKTVELHGTADWKVQKSPLHVKPLHVYDKLTKDFRDETWTQYGVSLSKAELLQPLVNNEDGITVDLSGATIALCNASGSTTSVNINPNAKLNADGSITYTSVKPGMDTVYYLVSGIRTDNQDHPDMILHYEVYTYAAANNIYVLDYGLPVEIAGPNFGHHLNDHLTVTQNTHKPTTTVNMGLDNTGKKAGIYGDFIYTSTTDEKGVTTNSLKYTPTKIINDIDPLNIAITVRETLPEGVTLNENNLKFYGVDLTEVVTMAPANVVYYEENFEGITYIEGNGNEWVQYETKVQVGVDAEGKPIYESVAGIEQSPDPDSNYGSDPNYAEDKEGQLISDKDTIGTEEDKLSFQLDTTNLNMTQEQAIAALNKYLGLQGGGDSNGTVKEMVVRTDADVMQFSFVGTGFEILSRTTDSAYAVLEVRVEKITRNEAGEIIESKVVRGKPVITESIGGDLYQVPIISIQNLQKWEYRVTVKAAGSTSTKTRILFIDGIRIYGPLDDGEALLYYNPEEYQAAFFEVKKLIEQEKVIYADASDSTGHFEFVTGTTLIEDQSGNIVLTSIDDVEQYMKVGPNNELYLDGISTNSVIAFFLKPMDKDENGNDYPEGARTLEIGAHRKADTEALDRTNSVNLVYGSTEDKVGSAVEGDVNFYPISTGTEMYYTIDIGQLVYDEYNGGYLVMIGTNGTGFDEFAEGNEEVEAPLDCLALTTIKVAGYEILPVTEMLFPDPGEDEGEGDGDGGGDAEGQSISPNSILYQPYMLLRRWVEEAIQKEEADKLPVNEELSIISAAFRADSVVSGKTITLTVRTTSQADRVVLTDSDGNEFVPTKCTVKNKDGDLVFTFTWKASGSRGDKFTYTIRAYDANDLASVNAETVTVTIK